MRTCVHQGVEKGPGNYACDNRASGFHWCEEDASADNSPGCFVPLPAAAPEQEKVPDSTPVTFADLLRHHRRLAQDPRADRAWHEEAVECLRDLALDTTRACHYESCLAGPYDSQRCHKAACPVWQARKAVEVEG